MNRPSTTTILMRLFYVISIIFGMFIPLGFANAALAVPQNGLVGYWPGDGNANDLSATGNNGSFSGSYVAGVNGQAFDLSTAKVSIPDNPAYIFSSGFSLGFWLNLNGNTNGAYLVAKDPGPGPAYKWMTWYDNAYSYPYPTIGFYSGGNLWSDQVNITNGWNQITIVRDDNNTSFYLNGNNIGDSLTPGPFDKNGVPITFGTAEGGPSSDFNGLMQNVVLYNRALTASEVQSLANPTAVPVPAAGWLFGSALAGLGFFGKRRKNG